MCGAKVGRHTPFLIILLKLHILISEDNSSKIYMQGKLIMENNKQQETSFRGMPIPEITKKQTYQVANSQQVIDRIAAMTPEEQKKVTLTGIHYEDKDISEVKLSTGEVVPVEAAIALADNALLYGFRAGRNARGDRTLRAMPNYDGEGKNSIHNLPQF